MNYLNFLPGVNPQKEKSGKDLWFVYNTNRILLHKSNESARIPRHNMLDFMEFGEEYYLGNYQGHECYAAEIEDRVINTAEEFEFMDIRTAGRLVGEEMFMVMGRGNQIVNWDKNNRFCGKCGRKLHKIHDQRAKICPDCRSTYYPQLSPAIIVSVIKGDEILLAHNAQFREGLYSVLSGFVEAGETFEECVKREVMEEVGIKVKNIKYFGNQPWPFPNSVMIGFTAEYESGEIKADGVEISDAGWFKKGNLPLIPDNLTIARKLIDDFLL